MSKIDDEKYLRLNGRKLSIDRCLVADGDQNELLPLRVFQKLTGSSLII
jgi:hypothetical protein